MAHKESRAHAAMGGKKSSKKHSSGKKVIEIHIRPGKSGGFIVKHDLKHDDKDVMGGVPMPTSEEHVVPDMPSLQQHLADHMPESSDEDETNPQPESNPMAAGGGM